MTMTAEEAQVGVLFGIAFVVMIVGLSIQHRISKNLDLNIDQIIAQNRLAGTIQLLGFIMLLFLIFKYIVNAEY